MVSLCFAKSASCVLCLWLASRRGVFSKQVSDRGSKNTERKEPLWLPSDLKVDKQQTAQEMLLLPFYFLPIS